LFFVAGGVHSSVFSNQGYLCLKERHCASRSSLCISELGNNFLEYAGNPEQTEYCQIDKLSVLEDLSAPVNRKPI